VESPGTDSDSDNRDLLLPDSVGIQEGLEKDVQ
jgi:hypothetical protein